MRVAIGIHRDDIDGGAIEEVQNHLRIHHLHNTHSSTSVVLLFADI